MNKKIIVQTGLIFILLLISGITFFYHVSGPVIRNFDEAVYANNALDMCKSHDLICLRNHDQIDLYNTKPPLVIWLQSVSMTFLGYNELAVRLPSVLSAMVVVLFLMLFCFRSLNNYTVGVFSVVTLLSTAGYNAIHVVRTGDLDAIFVMWVTLYCLLHLHYIIHNKKLDARYFYLLGLGFCLAFYTKSSAGLIPAAGIFMTLLMEKRVKEIFRSRHFWYSFVLFVSVCAAYYIARESVAHGYLAKVWFSEYERMYKDIMPWHEQPPLFYFNNIINPHFYPFAYFIPLVLAVGFFSKEELIRKLVLHSSVIIYSYLLIISIPVVKLEWYDAVVFPLLSLQVGVLVYAVSKMIYGLSKSNWLKYSFMVLLLVLIYTFPYKQVMAVNSNDSCSCNYEWDAWYMRYLKLKHPEIKTYTVVRKEEDADLYNSIYFYVKAYNREEGYHITLAADIDKAPSDTLLVCQPEKIDSLIKYYNTKQLDNYDGKYMLVKLIKGVNSN